ncbi:hypothetical protein COCC4DRAFT_135094 [Bipolaris maydis ATCC 48331]|uniref:Uncharacterized protein n=2 Tax=Cochliobolus heterostrophus TaxID=5016 RepID=M2SM29_COCH5|nr:uncharacterized protein COCC4DRAFT_135094 [Bipolaris maydis ATCC 48331]EMD86365.1 hypothetical protein COCHEDRAFT_1160668 [Bipolaris maydis C5]ENI06315.1 hypothetical protein COCC4DRAFT_135094 [Bipolaris maydis ATCC 48331]
MEKPCVPPSKPSTPSFSSNSVPTPQNAMHIDVKRKENEDPTEDDGVRQGRQIECTATRKKGRTTSPKRTNKSKQLTTYATMHPESASGQITLRKSASAEPQPHPPTLSFKSC